MTRRFTRCALTRAPSFSLACVLFPMGLFWELRRSFLHWGGWGIDHCMDNKYMDLPLVGRGANGTASTVDRGSTSRLLFCRWLFLSYVPGRCFILTCDAIPRLAVHALLVFMVLLAYDSLVRYLVALIPRLFDRLFSVYLCRTP